MADCICIRLDRECADICEACGNECTKHYDEHCQRCSEASRKMAS